MSSRIKVKRFFVLFMMITLAIIVACQIRLEQVQAEIRNAPIVVGDLADSGYTPPSTYGHGRIVISGNAETWLIYDLPHVSGKVQKLCAKTLPTNEAADIDFFYSNGSWYKIRSGIVTLNGDSWGAKTKTHKWRDIISSKLIFDVRKPDFPYRMKVLLDKLRFGVLSPLEYVEGLKRSNPSCANIPNP